MEPYMEPPRAQTVKSRDGNLQGMTVYLLVLQGKGWGSERKGHLGLGVIIRVSA